MQGVPQWARARLQFNVLRSIRWAGACLASIASVALSSSSSTRWLPSLCFGSEQHGDYSTPSHLVVVLQPYARLLLCRTGDHRQVGQGTQRGERLAAKAVRGYGLEGVRGSREDGEVGSSIGLA